MQVRNLSIKKEITAGDNYLTAITYHLSGSNVFNSITVWQPITLTEKIDRISMQADLKPDYKMDLKLLDAFQEFHPRPYDRIVQIKNLSLAHQDAEKRLKAFIYAFTKVEGMQQTDFDFIVEDIKIFKEKSNSDVASQLIDKVLNKTGCSIHPLINVIDFSSKESFDSLKKYKKKLERAGLTVTLEKASLENKTSDMLHLRGSLEFVIDRLSTYVSSKNTSSIKGSRDTFYHAKKSNMDVSLDKKENQKYRFISIFQ